MKLYYIGTGAADWTQEAGARDGISRRFSCAVLDDLLSIDLAPTTPREYFAPSSPLGQVQYVLYTHSHNDHYDKDTLLALCKTRAVTVICDPDFGMRLPSHENLTHISATPLQEVKIGDYTILPLRANHRVSQHPQEQPLHFIISKDGNNLFWGADGAWLYCDTWQALLKKGPFDRLILDGTLGEGIGDWRIFEHNNLPMIRLMCATMRHKKVIKPTGQVWLTHLSRDAHESPVTLPATLEQEDLHVAYDNLEDSF